MRPALKWTAIGCGCLVALTVAIVLAILGLGAYTLSQQGGVAPSSPTAVAAKPAATLPAPTTAPPPTLVPTAVPTAVPTQAPPPTVTAVPPTATAMPTPPYEWVNIAMTSLPARPRYTVDVVVPPDYDDEQMTAVLKDAVQRAFRERPAAKAVIVFAYSSRAEVNRGADKGRALASSDRQGWTGDGTFSTFLPRPAQDEGRVYLTLGSMLGDQRETSVPR